MILGSSDSEEHRVKLGLAFLVVGVILVLWAWGSWVIRSTARADLVSVQRAAEGGGAASRAVGVFPSVLLGAALLVMVFLLASYVFIRASRRYRENLGRRGHSPTEVSDIWSTHKVKDFDDDD